MRLSHQASKLCTSSELQAGISDRRVTCVGFCLYEEEEADSWLGTVVTVCCRDELMQTTSSYNGASANTVYRGMAPLLCTRNLSEPYVRVGQVVITSARSPPWGCA